MDLEHTPDDIMVQKLNAIEGRVKESDSSDFAIFRNWSERWPNFKNMAAVLWPAAYLRRLGISKRSLSLAEFLGRPRSARAPQKKLHIQVGHFRVLF